MASAHLDELRRIARELAEVQQKAGDLARAFGRVLGVAQPGLSPEDLCDPEIAQAMGETGKPSRAVVDVVAVHGKLLFFALLVVPREVSRRAAEALDEGCILARSRCTCDGCTAESAAVAATTQAAIARSRAAAGGPR